MRQQDTKRDYSLDACITVIINPSSSRVERKLEYSEVLLSSNCVFEGSDVKICGTGFAVLKK